MAARDFAIEDELHTIPEDHVLTQDESQGQRQVKPQTHHPVTLSSDPEASTGRRTNR